MTAVFLDLDGTLMNSKPGIEQSLRHAFRASGHDNHADSDLTWMIGPPFQDSFQKLGIADAQPVLDAYRVHYQDIGMYVAEVYDGIFDMLAALSGDARRLYIATAKPHAYARQITAHFGLSGYMRAEFGPELDGTRGWKGDLLAHALEVTGEDPDASVMIGDRHHDIAAGREVGMRTLAVTWGYGEPDEWSGATGVVDHPRDIPAALVGLGG